MVLALVVLALVVLALVVLERMVLALVVLAMLLLFGSFISSGTPPQSSNASSKAIRSFSWISVLLSCMRPSFSLSLF